MALINVFLVRWADGFHFVKDETSITEHGRREAFISLGDVQSIAEAETICRSLFTAMADPQIATTLAIDPTGSGDVPYTDFRKGDYITAPAYEGGTASQRVRALTTSVDENGNVIHVPELRHVVEEEAERTQRWLKRLANGALGGASNAPSPTTGGGGAPTLTPIIQTELPPFSYPGPVALDVSGHYRPVKATRMVRWQASLRVAGTSTTTVSLLVNGVSVDTISLAAGDQYETEPITVDLSIGSVVQVQTTAVGPGAEDLVVQVITSG